jgi:hypothetical protein
MAKNFSMKNGKIIVYDKDTDKSFEAKPKNVFLESGRNTFKTSIGQKVDIIEKIYSDLDNQFAKVIQKVKENGTMTGTELKMLLFLAYIMKWRVPQYDKSFNEAKELFTVEDLGLGIKFDDTRLNIDLESQFNTELHQEIKRFLIAIQPFRFNDDYKKISQNSFLISTPFNAVIGDCPLNEIAIKSEEIFEDFVFPITEYLTLVYSQRIDKIELKDFLENGKVDNINQFLKDFSIARDLSTVALSGRFSGCSDKDYFDVIINGFKTGMKNSKTKDDLHMSIFNRLYNYRDYK